jgi:hypothetical protein
MLTLMIIFAIQGRRLGKWYVSHLSMLDTQTQLMLFYRRIIFVIVSFALLIIIGVTATFWSALRNSSLWLLAFFLAGGILPALFMFFEYYEIYRRTKSPK